MSTTETTDQKQQIRDYFATLGVTYQATFQPTPQPRETVKHPQLHWLITLTRGTTVAQFPYFEGVGHVKGYKQFHKTDYDRRQAEAGYRKTCETGKLYTYGENCAFWSTNKVHPAPDVLDVLYCLTLDTDVLNYSTYEEWGPALGYDVDSRKGEATYRACVQQSLALKNLIGFAGIEKLTELYQDY